MDNQTILAVWNKGTPISNSSEWRKDECGAWIRFQDYGNRNTTYGWEVDHITSVDHGGSDALSNLRPLQWENNVEKSNGRLSCKVTSSDTKNIYIS